MPSQSASFARMYAIAYEMSQRPAMVYTQENSIGTATRADGITINLLDQFGLDRVLCRKGQAIDEDWMTNSTIGYAIACSYGWNSKTGGVAAVNLMSMAPIFSISYIEDQAAFLQTQVGGQLRCPCIIIQPGPGRSSVTQHANVSTEAKFANIPGIVIVNPYRVYDVKGLMHAMCAYGGPCVYVSYSGQGATDIPDEPFMAAIGKGNVLREGKDLTMCATPPSSSTAQSAITAMTGTTPPVCDPEFFDPVTVHPFDEAGLIASVKKTGRLFCSSDGYWTNDFTGHMMAMVAMALPGTKMWRVTYADAGAPFSSAMNTWMRVDATKIQDAVTKFMKM